LSPFLEILPGIKDGGYAGHNAMISVSGTLPPHTDLSVLADGDYFLSINNWLEDGGKVADWIPGETTYHYEMLTEVNAQAAESFLHEISGWPLIGVYCSAYGNARHWGFWTYKEWREFLEKVVAVLSVNHSAQFIFLGAEYDLQIAEFLHEWMAASGISSYLTLGSFHIGTTIEIIRRLDYLFSFPSGLGFLADVVDTPNLMWFPQHLKPMMGTFCDPENYEARQSFHTLFATPETAFQQFKLNGLKFLEDKSCRLLHEVQQRKLSQTR